jgi:hypothetical protein
MVNVPLPDLNTERVNGFGVIEFDDSDGSEFPTLLVATTANVYSVPFVSPVTVSGEAGPLEVKPPGVDVTVYEVIAAPPSLTGAVNVIVACKSPAVATTEVGASGTVTVATAFDGSDGSELPAALFAITVNVYVSPDVNPVTVMGDETPFTCTLPGFDITVYEVTGVIP